MVCVCRTVKRVLSNVVSAKKASPKTSGLVNKIQTDGETIV